MSYDFKASYASAKAELARLQKRKAELADEMERCDQERAALAQTLRALAPLIGETPPDAVSTLR